MERLRTATAKINVKVFALLVLVSGIGLTMLWVFRPGTKAGNALQQGLSGLSTQEAKLVVQIDEMSYTKTANKQNFMPYSYRMRTGATYGGGPTVWWATTQGSGTYGVTITETQISQALNFTKPASEVLYCKNGSSRIYWGTNLNDPANLVDILFKWNGKWCLGDQVPKAQISGWISAIIAGRFTTPNP